MATKEPQTRRAFGEQGVSRWLPALACLRGNEDDRLRGEGGAWSKVAETNGMDEAQLSS
jgi:hypothetical protein